MGGVAASAFGSYTEGKWEARVLFLQNTLEVRSVNKIGKLY